MACIRRNLSPFELLSLGILAVSELHLLDMVKVFVALSLSIGFIVSVGVTLRYNCLSPCLFCDVEQILQVGFFILNILWQYYPIYIVPIFRYLFP